MWISDTAPCLGSTQTDSAEWIIIQYMTTKHSQMARKLTRGYCSKGPDGLRQSE